MKKYVCEVCDWIYDPAEGDPDGGIEPGTAFEDIPDDWVCPLCGVGKEDFKLIEAWGTGIQKMKEELLHYPEIELILQEAGYAFQIQFRKKEVTGQFRTSSGQAKKFKTKIHYNPQRP